LLFVFLLVGLAAGDPLSTPCLPYEPAEVSLVGEVRVEEFPGPPNYEDLAKGDRPEHVFVLVLESAVCTSPTTGAELEPLDRIEKIQLVVPSGAPRPEIGKRVRVSGALFGAHTGHHHYPLLMIVASVRAV